MSRVPIIRQDICATFCQDAIEDHSPHHNLPRLGIDHVDVLLQSLVE